MRIRVRLCVCSAHLRHMLRGPLAHRRTLHRAGHTPACRPLPAAPLACAAAPAAAAAALQPSEPAQHDVNQSSGPVLSATCARYHGCQVVILLLQKRCTYLEMLLLPVNGIQLGVINDPIVIAFRTKARLVLDACCQLRQPCTQQCPTVEHTSQLHSRHPGEQLLVLRCRGAVSTAVLRSCAIPVSALVLPVSSARASLAAPGRPARLRRTGVLTAGQPVGVTTCKWIRHPSQVRSSNTKVAVEHACVHYMCIHLSDGVHDTLCSTHGGS
jgi:hypothetical protein